MATYKVIDYSTGKVLTTVLADSIVTALKLAKGKGFYNRFITALLTTV